MINLVLGVFIGIMLGDAILFVTIRSSVQYIPFVSYAYYFVEFAKRLKEKKKREKASKSAS